MNDPRAGADPKSSAQGTLLTAGHGTADRRRLAELLTGAGVGSVVDVRRFPGSRRNPDVASESMAAWLPAAGIAYRWEPRLGGRRRLPRDQEGSVDGWWQVAAFRAYAAHMRTPEFRAAFEELTERARSAPPVLVMCSESLWWRCHRRLISDAAVLLADLEVRHLGHDGRLTVHRPPDEARVGPDGLHYD